MRALKFVGLPFLAGLVFSRAQGLLPAAHADVCEDERWLITNVTVEGVPIEVPDSGHLQAHRLVLSAENYQVQIDYQ